MKTIIFLILTLTLVSANGETVMSKTLEVGEQGSYKELSAKPNPHNLSIVYIPAITLMLARAEELKGKELSESEIINIRDGAPATAMTKELADSVISERDGIE